MSKLARMAIRIQGIVQGVGFRPFIFTLAGEYALSGWVTNDSAGVLLEVEGPAERVSGFLAAIPLRVPPLARIDRIETSSLEPQGDRGFTIRETDRSERVRTLIAPDMATCDDCLRELFDPADRRYLYPFINCTNCGPRFTIIEEMPYDRPFTTMREFAMCPSCDGEYHNPRHRRFHAQPNACPACGPQVRLTDAEGAEVPVREMGEPHWAGTVRVAREMLKCGKIVGVKGIGGYHLVCDGSNAGAVSRLRKRKHRPDRPLAVMMPDLESVHRYCRVCTEEENLLQGPERPVLLLEWKKKGKDGLAENVAPGQSRLGVMLPYTPLHHLLFDGEIAVLVMTSGNISGEPILYDDAEAVARLGQIADYFLLHNRRIVRPCDDSVQRVDDRPVMIRRSRGYAPMSLTVKGSGGEVILAAGGELKNTFALARGEQVFLSQHIGDLKTRNSLHHYRRMIEEMTHLLELEPTVVAYDLHPGYLSARHVLERFPHCRPIGVQHHHAHVAGCMAEWGLDGPVIGISFDGTGYGTDGKIWGGEILIAAPDDFQRYAHLRYIPLPGGDQAVHEPWRMGAAYLEYAFPGGNRMDDLPIGSWVEPAQWALLRQMMEKGVQSPETSSMGRLFDAIAAILGIRGHVTFEGQAAMELEELAENGMGVSYPFAVVGPDPTGTVTRVGHPREPAPAETGGSRPAGAGSGACGPFPVKEVPRIIDLLPMIRAIAADLRMGVERRVVARRFHGTVVEVVRVMAVQIRREYGLTDVVLSGGVFQNRLLSMGLTKRLEADGFTVYRPQRVPANDGGLALGQAYAAGAILRRETDAV